MAVELDLPLLGVRLVVGVADQRAVGQGAFGDLEQAALPRRVSTARASSAPARTPLSERSFRFAMCVDGAANDKLAAGFRSVLGDTEKLLSVLRAQLA